MTSVTALAPSLSQPVGVKVAAALAGALAVAAAAQVAIPLPGTPVPMTLQPLAVLVVGGLLGARYGALSLAMYLAMGAAGLPVFTPLGVPGLARLLGPTGGYLLAYPVAAALAGWAAGPPTGRNVAAAFLGMLCIHVGGAAQLVVLTGSPRAALTLGTLPFLAGDLVKVALAALILRRFGSATRALR